MILIVVTLVPDYVALIHDRQPIEARFLDTTEST